MSIIDIPLDKVPVDKFAAHVAQLKAYLRNTEEPNETASDGRTCVSIALVLCVYRDGAGILKSLLDKGADPNLPDPFRNFRAYMNIAQSTEPLRFLIDAGLQLNHVYAPVPELFDDERPFTMLDYALYIQSKLNKAPKSLHRLAKKYASGLGARRRQIDETVDLLITHGAVCAPTQESGGEKA